MVKENVGIQSKAKRTPRSQPRALEKADQNLEMEIRVVKRNLFGRITAINVTERLKPER